MYFSKAQLSAIWLGKNKRKSCIKSFKTWKSLSDFNTRVQLWGPQSTLSFLFYFSGSINRTSYLRFWQG